MIWQNDTSLTSGSIKTLAALSIACGSAMLVAPRVMAAVFGLPRQRGLLRLFGARDVLIGGALLRPRTRRLGLALRSASDAVDGALILREVGARRSTTLGGTLRSLIAFGSAAYSLRLCHAVSARSAERAPHAPS